MDDMEFSENVPSFNSDNRMQTSVEKQDTALF